MTNPICSATQNIFSKFGNFVYAWSWPTIFAIVAAIFALHIVRDIDLHRQEVGEIAGQNPMCIYLESSDLGRGQHYMLCDNTITIKRILKEDASESASSVDSIMNLIVPAPSTPAAPTIPTAPKTK
jgi:hypothetical protein